MPKKSRILVFGTFDCLHPGHLSFLKQAKKNGDFLIVVIARDQNVKNIKGHWPRQNERIRLANLARLKIVDQVLLGHRYYKNRSRIIKKIKPHIICLGYDQPLIKLKNKSIKIIRLKPYQPNKYKSSLMTLDKEK